MQDGSLNAFSKQVNSNLPANVYYLLKYGADYLTPVEVDERLRLRLRQYYAFLGESVFQRRGRAFWDFHKDKLRDLGLPLDHWRLGRVVSMRLLDLILNPKRTLESIWRHLTRLRERRVG
jgi:hypothetical protein